MSAIGLLEGMQIAFFTVAKLPKSERGESPMAFRTCECLFQKGGKNLPGFMCGRQMTVTLCFFVIARVTTINVTIGGEEPNIFGVADGVQQMFNLGFMGAITTTILGSIAWQLVASSFPIAFLSNPIVFIFLQAALFLEATGICSAAWFFAVLQRKAMGYQLDEVFVGTPEERATKGHADDKHATDNFDMATYLPAHGVGTDALDSHFTPLGQMQVATYSSRREKVLSNIKELRVQLGQASLDEEEREAMETALKVEIQTLRRLNEDELKSKKLNESDRMNTIGEEYESDYDWYDDPEKN